MPLLGRAIRGGTPVSVLVAEASRGAAAFGATHNDTNESVSQLAERRRRWATTTARHCLFPPARFESGSAGSHSSTVPEPVASRDLAGNVGPRRSVSGMPPQLAASKASGD